MDFELISEEDFDNLPEEDENCFVEFEAICRRNMTRMLDDERSGDFCRSVQGQYMTAVYSVAQECGIHEIPNPPLLNDKNFYEFYSQFSLAVQGEVARIRIRGRRSRNLLSVQLTDNTQTKIQHYVLRLREIVRASNFEADRQKALNIKLDELIEELGKRRLNLGKAMAVLSIVTLQLAGATTIAAEGPDAITHIMRLIGADKESQDAALLRLASPLKALPAPQKPIAAKRPVAVNWDAQASLDDEIPF